MTKYYKIIMKSIFWLLLIFLSQSKNTVCVSVAATSYSSIKSQEGRPQLAVMVEQEFFDGNISTPVNFKNSRYQVVEFVAPEKKHRGIKKKKEWLPVNVTYSQKRENTILGWPVNRYTLNCTAPYLTRWTSSIVPRLPATYGHSSRYDHHPFHLQDLNITFTSQLVFMLPNGTSGFVQCESVRNASVATKVYIYAQDGDTIIQNNQRNEFEPPIITDTRNNFLVPCRVNYVDTTLQLLKVENYSTGKEPFQNVSQSEIVGNYDPEVGFLVKGNGAVNQRFKCKTLNVSKRKSDRITFNYYNPHLNKSTTADNATLQFYIGSQEDDFPLGIWCRTEEIKNQIKMISCNSQYECDWLNDCFYDKCTGNRIVSREAAVPYQKDKSNVKSNGIIREPFTRGKLICVSPSLHQVAYEYLFTGLDRRRYWLSAQANEFPKSAIIYIDESEPVFYSNKPASFACETSNFLLLPNIKFAALFNNGSKLLLDTVNTTRDPAILVVNDLGFSRKEILTNLTTEMVGIMCLAPWLNSSSWINTSRTFEVRDVQAPSISPSVSKIFYIGDKGRNLFCNATGEPPPTIQWIVPSHVSRNFETINEKDATLHFPDIFDSSLAGTYKCISTNDYGTADFDFVVGVEQQTLGLGAELISAIVASFGGLIIGLIVYIRKYILAKKLIKDLTPEEVREFLYGRSRDESDEDKNPTNDANASITRTDESFLSDVKLQETHNDKPVQVECEQELPATVVTSLLVNVPLSDLQNDARQQEADKLVTEDLIQSMEFDRNFEIQPADINILKSSILGEGNFGRVTHAVFGGELVAAKTTKQIADKQYFKAFLCEIKILQYIGRYPHPNIVQYLGAVITDIQTRKAFVVVELSPLGNLKEFLQNLKSSFMDLLCEGTVSTGGLCYERVKKETSTLDLVSWCEQIACGMDFLTSKKIIHGDLAARNILRFKNGVVKITDFGLSRKLYGPLYQKKNGLNKVELPLNWMAFESLKFLQFSPQSDVWSFGVTVWEIFSLGQEPLIGTDFDSAIKALGKGRRLEQPPFLPARIYNELQQCWRINLEERPSFSFLENYFGSALASMRHILEAEAAKQAKQTIEASSVTTTHNPYIDFMELIEIPASNG